MSENPLKIGIFCFEYLVTLLIHRQITLPYKISIQRENAKLYRKGVNIYSYYRNILNYVTIKNRGGWSTVRQFLNNDPYLKIF